MRVRPHTVPQEEPGGQSLPQWRLMALGSQEVSTKVTLQTGSWGPRGREGGCWDPSWCGQCPETPQTPPTLGTAGCPIPTQPPRLLLSDDWRDSPGRGPWTS